MKKPVKAILWVCATLVIVVSALLSYLMWYLPNPDPAPDISVEITPERLQRGEYLAMHVSSCMDCHSVRDFSLFAGPPTEGTLGAGGDRFGREIGLPGEVFARNLTPVNLQHYTDGELFRAITTGIDRHGKVLFPIMPFEAYRHLNEEDVYSIIAFLRTLEPVEGEYPPAVLDFPLNILINTLGKTYVGGDIPHPSDKVAYGRYITTIAACADCHHPGVPNTPDYTRPFAGGSGFQFPDGSVVRAMNITPDPETGIGNWTREMFIQRFKAFDPDMHPNQTVEPGTFNTIMPWTMYAGMTEEDIGAIYDYLRTVEPIKNPVERFTPPAN